VCNNPKMDALCQKVNIAQNNETEQWVQDTIAAAPDAYKHLRGKTEKNIHTDNMKILCRELGVPRIQLKYMKDIPPGYRITENINELCRGRYIRWMSRSTFAREWKQWCEGGASPSHPCDGEDSDDSEIELFRPTITAGGFLANITMGDFGTKITWRNRQLRSGCFMLDDCIVFQALSNEENLCLAVQSLAGVNN
jgi:hypothetical protein